MSDKITHHLAVPRTIFHDVSMNVNIISIDRFAVLKVNVHKET